MRDQILARLALAERDEESVPLDATLRLREITRAQLRDAQQWATSTDMVDRERERGQALASADLADEEARRTALSLYWQGAAETATDVDRWHAALFAAFVIDPETGESMFGRDEILTWPQRPALWAEVRRIAQVGLDLAEIGASHLKKES